MYINSFQPIKDLVIKKVKNKELLETGIIYNNVSGIYALFTCSCHQHLHHPIIVFLVGKPIDTKLNIYSVAAKYLKLSEGDVELFCDGWTKGYSQSSYSGTINNSYEEGFWLARDYINNKLIKCEQCND